VILTEGPTDIPIIKAILTWKQLDLKYNIKFWPMGGDVMNNLDLEVLSQDHEVIALLDSDFQSSKCRNEFKQKCQDLKIDCFQLNRYAIENYFSLEAIKTVFNKVPAEIAKLNPKKSIKDQIGFNIKSKNYQIIKYMTLKDFENTDLLEFCNKIENKLISTVPKP
jgi:5S rRNA maturation endonuclease (ribonuclease M5)